MRTGVHVNAIPCWPNLQHAALVKSRWLNSSKNIPTSLRSISINNRNTGRKRHSLEQLDGPLDDHLSKRPLALDPQGYFIISIDRHECRIIAEHYGNTINDQGLACDEETGEVIGCKGVSLAGTESGSVLSRGLQFCYLLFSDLAESAWIFTLLAISS